MPFGPIVEPGPATQPGRRGVRVRWGGPQGSGGSEHRALLTGRGRVDKTDGLQLVVVVGPGGLSRVTEPALRSAQTAAYQRYGLQVVTIGCPFRCLVNTNVHGMART